LIFGLDLFALHNLRHLSFKIFFGSIFARDDKTIETKWFCGVSTFFSDLAFAMLG